MRVASPVPAALLVAAALSSGARAQIKKPLRPLDPAKVEAMRVERLAEQKAALAADLAAMEAFGHQEEFLAAVRAVLADVPADADLEGMRPVKEGVVQLNAFDSYQKWVTPGPGREVPIAWDVGSEGHPYAAIVDLNRQLRARGVEFLVVAAPTRLETYPELILDFESMEGFAGMGAATTRFLLALNEAGVETLSLHRIFAQARTGADADDLLFLRTDPHWMPRGVELTARSISEVAAKHPWFHRGPWSAGRHFKIDTRKFFYGSGEDLASRGSQIEVIHGTTLHSGQEAFDGTDKRGPFIVLGDSFVRVHRQQGADLCAHLARFTGHKIDVIQAPGDGAKGCREKLARREAAEWDGKHLVIWVLMDTTFLPGDRWATVPIFPAE